MRVTYVTLCRPPFLLSNAPFPPSSPCSYFASSAVSGRAREINRVYSSVSPSDVVLISAILQISADSEEIPSNILDICSSYVSSSGSLRQLQLLASTVLDLGSDDRSKYPHLVTSILLEHCERAPVTEETIKTASYAVKLSPDHPRCYVLSDMLVRVGKNCEAIKVLEGWRAGRERKVDGLVGVVRGGMGEDEVCEV